MTSNRTILINGVTGNQGGAVAQALQGTGFYLRGLTRKPDSERAAALARHGVDIFQTRLSESTAGTVNDDRTQIVPEISTLSRRHRQGLRRLCTCSRQLEATNQREFKRIDFRTI